MWFLIAYLTIDESNEFPSHISVVIDINATAPELNFYFHLVSESQLSDNFSNLNIRKPTGPSF